MILALIYWISLWISLPLVGKLIARLFDKKENNLRYFEYLWIGYAGLTGYLQILSFFFSMQNPLVFYGWLALDFVSLILVLRDRPNFDILSWVKSTNARWKSLLFGVVIITIGLYSSTKTVGWYDTYLYHFNMVAWNRNFPVVPGLANLHDRLGFNSSFHLVASFIERFSEPGYSTFILSGFLIVTLILYLFSCVNNVKLGKFPKLFALLMIPYMVSRMIGVEASSLSTDLAVAVFAVVFVTAIIQEKRSYLYIATLALLLPTIKLSAISAPIVMLGIFIYDKVSPKDIIKYCAIGAIVLLGFMGRNIIISGYPLYPSTILGISSVWQVPKESAQLTSDTVKGWARLPGGDYLNSLSGGIFYWVSPWWKTVRNSSEIKILAMVVVSLFVLGKKNMVNKSRFPTLAIFLLLSIALLLILAPDLRFGAIYFWILGAGALAQLLSLFIESDSYRDMVAKLVVISLLSFWVVPQFSINRLRPPLFSMPYEIGTIPLSEVLLVDGTKAWKPIAGDLCGNGMIPCFPYDSTVRLIKPDDLNKGFKHD